MLRFFAGISIGGVLANISPINAEFAPRRYVATAVIAAFSGTAFGGALPGVVTTALVPSYGWPILFHIGSILPLVMAAIVALRMPESIQFLTLRDNRHPEVRRTIGALEPGLVLSDSVSFTLREEGNAGRTSPKYLFADGLASMTVLLWLILAVSRNMSVFCKIRGPKPRLQALLFSGPGKPHDPFLG